MLRLKILSWCIVLSMAVAGSLAAQGNAPSGGTPAGGKALPIWNFHKLQKWYNDHGLTLRHDDAIVPPRIVPMTPLPPDQPDVQVYPSSNHETENSIAVSQANPLHLMVSVNELNSQPAWFSTDGGATWFGNELDPGGTANYGDPVALFDLSGAAYWGTLGSPGGIMVGRTTDFGTTWTVHQADPLASGNDDKEHVMVDQSGVYPNNVYAAWTDFNISGYPVQVTRSTDKGVTWSARTALTLSGAAGQGTNIQTGPDGEVYVTFAALGGSSLPESGIAQAKSTDGGATWSTARILFPIFGIRVVNTGQARFNNTRAPSFPTTAVDRSTGPRRGWVYVAYSGDVSSAHTDADIYFTRSTDGGATYSTPVRVNTEAPGSQQWMPGIAVDPTTGGISLGYYSMDTTVQYQTARYVASSMDGGDTWQYTRVSDVRFLPSPLPPPYAGGYCGDYYETAAMNGKAWACWSDNRSNSIFNAFVSKLLYAENFGWVRGTVTNVSGGAALGGVGIDFTDQILQQGATTDPGGFYLAGAKVDTPGTTRNVTLRARKFGFHDTLLSITLTRNDTLARNFAMTPVPSGTLIVRTVGRDSANIKSAITVLFNGQAVASGYTDSLTGIFSFVLPFGNYDILVDPPSPFGTQRFNNFAIGGGNNPLYVVVRAVIENSPGAMRDTLAVGQVHAKTMVLTNTTASDTVAFRLSDDNTLARMRFSKPAVQPRKNPIIRPERPKGAPDTEFGTRPTGSGGPDAFGYRWVDSDSTGGGVTYNWVEINSIGTPVTQWVGSTDDGSFSTTLPWPFPFYGNSYTNFFFTTNGWLGFNTPSTQYSNAGVPDPAEPNNAIYAWWDDLQATGTSGDGTVYYYADNTNGQYIVEYNNVRHLGATSDTLKFEAILKPNGEIRLQYNHMVSATNLTSATIGIENADGSVGLQVVYNAAYVHDNLAIRFYLPDAAWLSENPSFGRIPPGGTQNITVTFDAGTLQPGTTYNGKIIMDAAHPDITGSILIPASLKVNVATTPVIIVSRTTIPFPPVEIGTQRTDSLTVRNGGSPALNISSISSSNPRFVPVPTSASINPADSIRVRVTYSATYPAHSDTGRLIILSNDPLVPRLDVMLSASSYGVAHMFARPDTFYFSRGSGTDTTRANFKIYSTGTDTLRYRISESGSAARPNDAASIARSKVQHPANNLPKGAIDPSPGEVDSTGGPDAFGYRWIDSDTPGGPVYNWIDISTIGTPITTWTGTADDGYATVPFPLNFSLYGTPFTGSINVVTNGFLSFTSTLTAYTNMALPAPTGPLNGIFPFWDDLNLSSSGNVFYYYDSANNQFIVEYLNVPHFSTGGPYTFEVILKADGSILYQYQTMDLANVNSSTIGIQNATGTVALQVCYNSVYLHNSMAVLITSDLIPWMSTDKTFGTVAPGDSTVVSLRVHPANLTAGDYLGYQRVTGNTPDVAPVRVRLHITGVVTPTVTVTSPNGGEQWLRGQTYPITWAKTGAVDTVKIEFSTAGSGGPWTVITAGAPAKIGLQRHPKFSAVGEAGGEWDNPNGTFNWLIPASTPASTNCFVRVSWKSDNTVTDMSNSAFTILAGPLADTVWTVQTSGTTTAFYCVKALDNNIAWAGGGTGSGVSGFVRRTTDGGTTWTAAGTFPADVFDMTAINANIAIAANYTSTYTRLVKTTDGGATWRTVDSVAGGFYDNVVMFDANNGYAQGDPVGGNWILKKTTDGGNTWVAVTPALPQVGTEAGWNNSMSWVGTNGWFGTNNTKIYRTTDGGSTWTGAATTFANSYSVAFADVNNGITGSDTGPVDKSTNGGGAWTLVPGNMTTSDFSLWANPGSQEWWCSSGNNVYYSSNFGTSWSASPKNGYTGSQQANHVNMVKIGGNLYGWMVGNAGTVVRFRRTVVGVNEAGNQIPTVFALSQNYPNPFNPSTRIKYELPEQATVVLKVYNVLGQEVATLANTEQAPGFYEVMWNGQNNFGTQVSSGVYFYRFEAKASSGHTFATLKKMLFLK